MRKGDFHVHTRMSDGAFSPSDVVRMAKNEGIQWLSITDHDSMDAYSEAVPAAQALDMTLICGVELSTSLNQKDCHLLVYGLAADHPVMRETLQSQKSIRYTRAKALLDTLRERGIDVSIEDVAATAGHLTLGRMHVANTLVAAGIVPTLRAAFDQYLSFNGRKSLSPFPSVFDMIDRFRGAGAITVLAHPGTLYNFTDLQRMVAAGLQGIEIVHPSHDATLRKKYQDYATLCGLIHTGGSDFHGTKPDDSSLLGTVALNEYDSLKLIERIEHVCEPQR